MDIGAWSLWGGLNNLLLAFDGKALFYRQVISAIPLELRKSIRHPKRYARWAPKFQEATLESALEPFATIGASTYT